MKNRAEMPDFLSLPTLRQAPNFAAGAGNLDVRAVGERKDGIARAAVVRALCRFTVPGRTAFSDAPCKRLYEYRYIYTSSARLYVNVFVQWVSI